MGKILVQLTFLESHSKSPRYSPNGQWIVFGSGPNRNNDIFVISAEGGAPKRITHDPSLDVTPSWSNDGSWIYFVSNRSGSKQIWKTPKNGGNVIQVTEDGGERAYESSDGESLYYTTKIHSEIWKIQVRGWWCEIIHT